MMDHLLKGWNLWDSDKNLQLLLEGPSVITSQPRENDNQQQQPEQQIEQIQQIQQQIQEQIQQQQLQQQQVQQQQQLIQQQQVQHQNDIQTHFLVPNLSGGIEIGPTRCNGSQQNCGNVVGISDENVANTLNHNGLVPDSLGDGSPVIISNNAEEMVLQKDADVLSQSMIQNQLYDGPHLHNQTAIAQGSMIYNQGQIMATRVYRNPIDVLQEHLFQSYPPILPKTELQHRSMIPPNSKSICSSLIETTNNTVLVHRNHPSFVNNSDVNNLIENVFLHENFNSAEVVPSSLVVADSTNMSKQPPTFVTTADKQQELPQPGLKPPEEKIKPKLRRIHRGVHRLPCSIRQSARLHAYVCDICGGELSTKFNLKKHKAITHSDAKPWQCDICGKAFKRKGVLKTHKLTHSEEKPFQCMWCEKRFKRKADLNEHIVIHKDGKPYECMICGNRFTQYSTLRTHALTHSGEHRFSCDVCGRWFSVHSNLISHKLTHSREQPFECQICGRKFSLKGNLKRHMTDIHSAQNNGPV